MAVSFVYFQWFVLKLLGRRHAHGRLRFHGALGSGDQQAQFYLTGKARSWVVLAGGLNMGDFTFGSLPTDPLVNRRHEAGFHALNVARVLFVFIFDPNANDAWHLCPSTLCSGMERVWRYLNEVERAIRKSA